MKSFAWMVAFVAVASLSAQQPIINQGGLPIISNGGGGGSFGTICAGSSDTQVLFNDGGACAGDAGLVFNKTTNVLTAGSVVDSALTATRVTFAGASGLLADSANLTFATPALTIGVAGSATGALKLTGATSGTVTQTVAAAAGTWTFTVPPDDGDAGEFLQTNGSGVSTWETVTVAAPLTLASGSITVSAPYLTGTQTWNDAGVTFDAELTQITNTASAAASTLLNRQIGGVSRFKMFKSGAFAMGLRGDAASVTDPNASATEPTLSIQGNGYADVYLQNNTSGYTSGKGVQWDFSGSTLALSVYGTGSNGIYTITAGGGASFNNATAVTVNKTLGYAGTTAVAVADVGANSCGTTAATIAGNDNAFAITTGATGATQCRVTFTRTAPVRWYCMGNNETAEARVVRFVPVSTTTGDFFGTLTGGDVVSAICFPR